ncbi:MAG: hypothetical protein Q7R41_10265 [Phycisphaerales bacterium]|nr:hypothetical protein [Phycisphaerales bacterium]
MLISICWAVFALTILCPAVALFGNCFAQGATPSGGFTFTARQFGLLWRSLWLSGAATAACITISIPAAFVLGRSARITDQPLTAAAMLATLLCPPMVYSFGWQRALPGEFDPHLRCILVWSLWAWPIPAMIIGAGWARVGRRAFEAAILTTSGASAFVRVVLPLLLRYVGLSVILLFVLFFGDYGTPHANGLLVYATELLGWASDSSHTIDTLWPATLPVALTALALCGVAVLWRNCALDDESDVQPPPSHSSRSWPALTLLLLAVTWLPPMSALVVRLGSGGVFLGAIRTYGRDIAVTFVVALAAAILVMLMAAGIAASERGRRFALAMALLFGAMPGAVIGEALITAYNHPLTAALYDHWPIVALGYAARFGWMAMLAASLIARGIRSSQADQARTDGASEPGVLIRVLLPQQAPLIVGVLAAITVLAVADVATSTLVRVPAFNPIAHVIIEKFHRFEDGMMISLSFILVAAAIIGAGVLCVLQRCRRVHPKKGGGVTVSKSF